MRIILASGSPRRKELLKKLIGKFDIIISDFDENIIKSQEKNSEELVKKLSLAKANDILSNLNENKDFTIIAADTIVCINDEILGKPLDEHDAKKMLEKLSNNIHFVLTGMTVIINKNGIINKDTVCSKSTIYFNKLTESEIIEYINTGEPLDKAGSYAIQGIGNKFIKKYKGNFDSIVGLDTIQLKDILEKYGVL
ncbi:MAG: septum formation protein Maf [Clostridia bacterium]|nr:septum formation protein Maf [Clostridia bacterium]